MEFSMAMQSERPIAWQLWLQIGAILQNAFEISLQ
jgi:hypothetical protein